SSFITADGATGSTQNKSNAVSAMLPLNHDFRSFSCIWQAQNTPFTLCRAACEAYQTLTLNACLRKREAPGLISTQVDQVPDNRRYRELAHEQSLGDLDTLITI